MSTLRKAGDRHHVQGPDCERWTTFNARDRQDPLHNGFGALASLSESRLPPDGRGGRAPRHDVEMFTYVLEGALAQEDSAGRSGVLQAGEFQRTTTGRGIRHAQRNASRTDAVRFFQVQLHPSNHALEPSVSQKRFLAANRRGVLCVVASPDGRSGSLRTQQEVIIYSSILAVGQHLVHKSGRGRRVWIHLVRGSASINGVILVTGDGMGLADETVGSITAQEPTEILILDLADLASTRNRSKPTAKPDWVRSSVNGGRK